MEEKGELEKVDDVMLPGFRFHPTDEELVDFYLKRKVLQRLLPIELIKQVDIYKYDPWDLPKLATTGEKEWYFYCPRDRKYRNSARPNRVTGAGFWKATGTDRPIYSSDGARCIGLKKSLVFYRGRAAKGIKTDWMMHEFRLPSIGDVGPPKKTVDKNIPPNESWAICRIYKKTNTVAQRSVISQSWVSSPPENKTSDILGLGQPHCPRFSSENNISCTTEIGDIQNAASTANFSTPDSQPYPQISKQLDFAVPHGGILNGVTFSPLDLSGPLPSKGAATADDDTPLSAIPYPSLIGHATKNAADSTMNFEGHNHFMGFPVNNNGNNHWAPAANARPILFPFSLPFGAPWDSDSPSRPSEMYTSFSTNKCYT